MAGILYLVPTPIGNLGDLSTRIIETLQEADFIAAEDTRVSLKILNHLGLKKPMVSYYRHNTETSGPQILARIMAGENCALVTDAGTPAISDPGDQKGYKAFPIGFDYSNREWFLQPMRTGKLHITNVHQSQVTGQLIITVSTVITDANDEIIGVLGADIQLEEIIRRAESLEAEVPNSEEE